MAIDVEMGLGMEEWETPLEESGVLEPMEGTQEPGWKDELNLAEFPIAALTDRVPDGQTTLVFEDKLERRDSPAIVSLARRRGARRPDPAHQAAEQLHRPEGAVLAV
jgi:hypothetical protein